MPQRISPFIEVKYGWNYGESGWNEGVDENFLKLSCLTSSVFDGVVETLPEFPSNGSVYYLTTDKRLYFYAGAWKSTPIPKWFILKDRVTGDYWEFNGSGLALVPSIADTASEIEDISSTLGTLGSAAFKEASTFATVSALDVASAQSNQYTDSLRNDLLDPQGSSLVGWTRTPITQTISSVALKLSSQPVNVWEYAASVTDRPDPLDPSTWDWTPAIQAAHDSGFESIEIPKGTFQIKSVNISHNMTVFGWGTESVLSHYPDAVPSTGSLVMFNITSHNLKFSLMDLVLDGNESNQSAEYAYGYMVRASNLPGEVGDVLSVVVHNCDLVNMCQAAISLDGDTSSDGYEELVVENCRFLNGRQGIGRSTALGISSFGPDYITLTDKAYARILNNSFIYNKSLAASTESSTAQFPPTAVRITIREGTSNLDSCRCLIAYNYFYGCGRGERTVPTVERPEDGIGVIDFYARGRAIRIIGNHFEASQGSPIRGKTNCDMVVVTGNIIDGTAANPGISIVPNTYADQQGRIIIQGNVVKDVSYHGIGVVGASGTITHEPPANTRNYVLDIIISENIIDNVDTWNPGFQTSDASGVYIRNAKSTKICSNNIRNVEVNGIIVRGTGGEYNSENIQITNNVVESCRSVGILTEQSLAGSVNISGNLVSDCAGFGINAGAASGSVSNLTLTSNSVRASDGYGVYSRYFSYVSASGNHVESVTGTSRGYRFDDTVSTKLVGNTVGSGVTTGHSVAADTKSKFSESDNSWNPTNSFSTTAPTTGTWVKGSVVWNNSPDPGESVGWVCTVTGTPGTWKSFGTVST
jgi:hypothetical protein